MLNYALIVNTGTDYRKILMYLCISIWIVISCVPIILTSEYLTEASIMALMFGHANALCIGVLFLLFI